MESMANCESDHHLGNLEATELTLGLPGAETVVVATKKRPSDGKTARAFKSQVVGWPPVRVCRMNSFRIYVKVSMDGAPYLRKIDLKMYKDYEELRGGLEDMFKCFSTVGKEGYVDDDEGEYAITYEDKDGDWMLVGDVPWEMFISSCKRIRIMKGCEARGLSSSA